MLQIQAVALGLCDVFSECPGEDSKNFDEKTVVELAQ